MIIMTMYLSAFTWFHCTNRQIACIIRSLFISLLCGGLSSSLSLSPSDFVSTHLWKHNLFVFFVVTIFVAWLPVTVFINWNWLFTTCVHVCLPLSVGAAEVRLLLSTSRYLNEIHSQYEIKALLGPIMGLHVVRYVVVDFNARQFEDANGQT